jgi:hypothetical protein
LHERVPPGIQGWRTKKNTKVAAIIPTMTKTIVGLAKLVLLSGGVMDGSMDDWMLVRLKRLSWGGIGREIAS